MAEKLFRWNGTQWVPVTEVTRIEVKIEGGGGGMMCDIPLYNGFLDYTGLQLSNIDKPS